MLDVTEDRVSYALKMLRLAGLVSFRRDGRTVCYRLSDGFPHRLLEQCLRELLRCRTRPKSWPPVCAARRISGVWLWLDVGPEHPCFIHPFLYSTAMTVSLQVDLGTLARVGTALADPTRRRVLVHLIDASGYPAEMAEEFGTTRANLSNHLTCLRECGLVTATAEGRRIRYDLADQRLADGLRILAGLDLPGSCG